MDGKFTGGKWLEILLFTVASLVLFHTGVGIPLFLIPLQVVASRRGVSSLLAAAGLFLVGFVGIRLMPLLLGGSGLPDILVYVPTGVLVLVLLGLVAVNLPQKRRPRTLALLAGAAAAAGIVFVSLGLWLSRNADFQASLEGLFAYVSKTLSGMFGPADAVAAALQELRRMAVTWIPRGVVTGYMMLLAFSWWAGQAFAARSAAFAGTRPAFHFARFHLEGGWLWPLIASGALVLADLAFGISFWAYAAWNVALGVLFLYGLQGLAILRFLFEKHGLPRFLWLLLIAVVVLLSGNLDRVSVYVLIVLPAFGVSENWIRYRVPRGAAPAQKS
jgi:hypothetical protein